MDKRFEKIKTFNKIIEYKNSLHIQASTYGFDNPNKDVSSIEQNSEYSIHFILSGAGFIQYEGHKTVRVKAGELFFLLPYNKKITYYADRQKPWCYCWLNFSGNITDILSKLNINIQSPTIKPSNGKEIKDIFYNMFTSSERYYNFSNFICSTTVNNLLFALLRNTESIKTKKKYSSHIDIAQKYVEANYQNPELTMEEVAKHCALNPTYFSKLFRQKTGVTFSAYLIDFRVRTAASLIHQGLYSVRELSESVGFSSQYYFSNQFLKMYQQKQLLFLQHLISLFLVPPLPYS